MSPCNDGLERITIISAVSNLTQRIDRLLGTGPLRAAAELVLVIAAFQIGIWNVFGAANRPYLVAALAMPIFIAWLGHRRRQRTGVAATEPAWSLGQTWAIVTVITVLLAVLILIASALIRTEGERLDPTLPSKLVNAGWLAKHVSAVVIQQIALHFFLFPACFEIVRHRAPARMIGAAVFGILHLPSMTFLALTFVGALIWSWLFERSRRLTPLIVSHFVLAQAVSSAMPERLTYNMAVGARALQQARAYQKVAEEPLASLYTELQSDAYYARNGGTDADFIRALYRDVLRRDAIDAEINAALPSLRTRSRADIVVRFLMMAEHLKRQCAERGTCGQP